MLNWVSVSMRAKASLGDVRTAMYVRSVKRAQTSYERACVRL